MSWFHAKNKDTNDEDHASEMEIAACFRDERDLLTRLALLITGDKVVAEESVVNACEVAVQARGPFRGWLIEWARSATITSAIAKSADAIRGCEPAYKNLLCDRNERFAQVFDADRERCISLVLGIDPSILITELDPLARAVLVLRTAIGASIRECTLRLQVSRTSVLAAQCRVVTWLDDAQLQRGLGGELANVLTNAPSMGHHSEEGL